MAKYESRLQGDFDDLLGRLHSGILSGSISAKYEDGSDYQNNGMRCALRVYERYSMIGSNRVSLSVTLIGEGQDLFISAITSGGSQAIFFKINTLGKSTFLNCAIDIIEDYRRLK